MKDDKIKAPPTLIKAAQMRMRILQNIPEVKEYFEIATWYIKNKPRTRNVISRRTKMQSIRVRECVANALLENGPMNVRDLTKVICNNPDDKRIWNRDYTFVSNMIAKNELNIENGLVTIK